MRKTLSLILAAVLVCCMYAMPAMAATYTAGTYTASAPGNNGPVEVSVTVSDLPATTPVVGANPGPLGATTGVARAFTVTVASGYPAPALALRSQTASSGYSFVPATGVLSYTPPEADAGARRIGWNSPLARALRGGRVGDLRTVQLPAGPKEWEIMAISYPEMSN